MSSAVLLQDFLDLSPRAAFTLIGNSLGGCKFNLTGSIIGAITIQALTTSLYALGVSADQLPVYKAVVVILIVALQSPEFKRWYAEAKLRTQNAKAGKAEVAK